MNKEAKIVSINTNIIPEQSQGNQIVEVLLNTLTDLDQELEHHLSEKNTKSKSK